MPSFRKASDQKNIEMSKSLPMDGSPSRSLDSLTSPKIQAFGRQTVSGEAVPAASMEEVRDLPDLLADAISDVEEQVQLQPTSRFELRSFSSSRRNPCFAENHEPSSISRASSIFSTGCPSPIDSAFDTLMHSAMDSALFLEVRYSKRHLNGVYSALRYSNLALRSKALYLMDED